MSGKLRKALCESVVGRKRTLMLAGAAVAVGVGVLQLGAPATFAPIQQACAQKAQMGFANDINPILKGWCVECHQPGGEGYEKSGLDLTSYDGVMKGTKFGPMVVPGQPDNSNLITLVEGRAKITMPLRHKALPNCLRNNIWSWIFEGAKNN
jgi:Planctomycete cytochrome C